MSRFGATIVFVSSWQYPPGIKAFQFDEKAFGGEGNWKLQYHQFNTRAPPICLHLNEEKDIMYSLCNIDKGPDQEKRVSTLTAIKFDPRRHGRMTEINSVELISDEGFCMCFSPGYQHVVVGQKGSIEIFLLGPNGEIGDRTHVHLSSRVDTGMIDHTCPTQLEFVAGESEPKIVILNTASNLNVMTMHDFDMATGVIVENDSIVPSWKEENCSFSKFVLDSSKWMIINKSTCEIFVYAPKQQELMQRVRTSPRDSGPNIPVDMNSHFHGLFVYVSNEGHNSIACFRCSSLELLRPLLKPMPAEVIPKYVAFQGENLYVSCDNDVYIFEIDPGNGELVESSPMFIEIAEPFAIAVYGD